MKYSTINFYRRLRRAGSGGAIYLSTYLSIYPYNANTVSLYTNRYHKRKAQADFLWRKMVKKSKILDSWVDPGAPKYDQDG